MKRSALERRTPLKRTSGLRRRLRTLAVSESGREAWKAPHAGWCQCGCDRFSLRLHRHHIVTEQVVRREGGDPWALANSMLLHPDCHGRHHSAFRRIPFDVVPDLAVDFARRLLGPDRAALYFARFYAGHHPANADETAFP